MPTDITLTEPEAVPEPASIGFDRSGSVEHLNVRPGTRNS